MLDLSLILACVLGTIMLCLSAAAGQDGRAGGAAAESVDLFELARANAANLRVSTLVMARDVDRLLGTPEQIDQAIAFCQAAGITRIFLETFRGGVQADRDQLVAARDRFRAAGIQADGCVTTLGMNPRPEATSYDKDCYADETTRRRLAEIFAFTAEIFDVIMIDDFFYTSCDCPTCLAGKGEGSWSDYRRGLMLEVSREFVLAPARRAKPDVQVIIKFPNWFDNLQKHGYDTAAQTEAFGLIWTGTETREPEDPKWGGVQTCRGFFIQRWLTAVGAAKNGGGWFDEIDTGVEAYVEQARQTVLGGAREMMLFNYASLNRPERAEHMARLRRELPELFRLAAMLRGLPVRGAAAVKPRNSDPGEEYCVYDYLGMLGVPLKPTIYVMPWERAIFAPTQAAGDGAFEERLRAALDAGASVTLTDGLAALLEDRSLLERPGASVLAVAGNPAGLLALDDAAVDALRRGLLGSLGLELQAPRRVASYLFGRELVALENFNNEPAEIVLKMDGLAAATVELALPRTDVPLHVEDAAVRLTLPARTLVVLRTDLGEPWRPRGVFVSDERIETLKARVAGQVEPTWSAWLKLRAQADAALDAQPHAMASWYVPGYYHDAEGHRSAKGGLMDDANTAYGLALAWRITGETRYAEAATRLIDAWPATVRTTRFQADSTLSFSYHFPAMVFAADLLDDYAGWSAEHRRDFRLFLREKALPLNCMLGTNNWGNWGVVLGASIASYLGDRELFDHCVLRWKQLLDHQVAPDGHLPHEVGRNEGRHGIWYSHFSLMPQTIAAEILRLGGVDLYDWSTADGRTLRMAWERLIPWVQDPKSFPWWDRPADELVGVRYYSYFELLNARWPNAGAAALLENARPMTAQHSAPLLTFTHGDLLDDGGQR